MSVDCITARLVVMTVVCVAVLLCRYDDCAIGAVVVPLSIY